MPLGLLSVGRAIVVLCLGGRCAGCDRRSVGSPCSACREWLANVAMPQDAAWPDAGPAARLVRAAKFGHWRAGGMALGRLSAERLRGNDIDLVTWVPAEPRRRATRGGHLPEQLARAWALELGVPRGELLQRRRGATQQGLDRAARHRNVRSAWRISRAADRTLRDASARRVLLVDDIRASGASLETAAASIAALGVEVRSFALVARDLPRRGVEPSEGRSADFPARCEEFSLTTGPPAADSVWHDLRKDAPRVLEPRPP